MPRVSASAAFHRRAVLAALAGVGVLASSLAAWAASSGPVELGTARSFAVLAGSGITNTGATTITGDVGTFPTTSETGFTTVTLNGTDHHGDSVTQGAKTDLVTAYNDAAGRSPATAIPVELGGTTLVAGVYSSGTFGLTGTLTLDAQGNPYADFIFQAGSTLTTASDSAVVLINGASPCHVVWQVASSATFGTRTSFVGDVLAQTSISVNSDAAFRGRLLARDGAVTLIQNTIRNAGCTGTSAVGSGSTPSATPTSAAPAPTATPTPTATAATVVTPTATTTVSPAATGSPAVNSPVPSPSQSAGLAGDATSPTAGGSVQRLPLTGGAAAALGLVGATLLVAGFGGMVAGRRRQPAVVPRKGGNHRA